MLALPDKFYIEAHVAPLAGAWIEMHLFIKIRLFRPSHPARGAWIEIVIVNVNNFRFKSHPARGAWIEICNGLSPFVTSSSRTPQGVRGLKWELQGNNLDKRDKSHPARGAWIEIAMSIVSFAIVEVAPRKGCVD